ncbi:GntR family transcriptional regulator [Mycolicibacterium porcinum]|nr:GntR family transcriptional regulator [Mycolicibacterium porcinum]
MTSERGLLNDSVHDALQEMIFSGELAPGCPLSVPALAAQLNVSRTPVREAVQQLIYEGLATHTRNAGARVAKLDAEGIKAVFQVREVLDGLAAHSATLNADRATVEQLRKMVQIQRDLLEEPADQHRDASLDLQFHTLIRETSGNHALCDALARLDGQAHLYRSDMWTTELNRRLAVTEHDRIVAAIEAGDASGACAAATAHVAGLHVRTCRS